MDAATVRAAKRRISDAVDETRWRYGEEIAAAALADEVDTMCATMRRPFASRRDAIDVRPFWRRSLGSLVPISGPEAVEVGDWLNWTPRYAPFSRTVFQVIAISEDIASCSVRGRHIDTWEPVEWPSWSPSCKVNLRLRHLRKLARR